ncbi:unnamed protein product, partial [Didymodactylos carnosus]
DSSDNFFMYNVTFDSSENVTSGKIKLFGTILIPIEATISNPVPGCLLVHGSGGNDRWEDIENNYHLFYDIATYLASNGIAVLVYDKRNCRLPICQYQFCNISPINDTDNCVQSLKLTMFDYVSDAEQAFKFLANYSQTINSKRLIIGGHSEALIFLYFIVEIVIGHITHSLALIADSFHMLADVLSLLIGLYSVRLSKKRSDINTYGWVRAEVVGANINTVFLLALSLTILFDVIQRYITPEPIRNVNMLLITGCVGLGINIIGMFLFQGFHGHSHGAGSHGDSHGGGKSHEHSHSTGDKRKEHGHSHGGHSRDNHGHGNDNPAHIPDVETPQKRTRHDSTGAEIFNHISNVTEFKRHSSRALEE